MPDTPGHDATRRDALHTMTLKELEVKIAQAGIIMSRRQIMRHCKSQTFDAQKLPAVNNVEEWFIAPGSVDKGIADIKNLQALRSRRDATRHDTSQHDAPEKSPKMDIDTSSHDATRPVMTQKGIGDREGKTEPDTSGYVAQLEKRIEEKDKTITFLQDELVDRRTQIGGMKEIIDGQRLLLESINNNVAPVFTALAEVARGKPDARDVVRATIVDAGEKREVGGAPNL